MQYPLSPEASLPTPPHSPASLVRHQPATALLDSLSAFYQQERYWIHHTRAALEHAISRGADAKAITFPDPDASGSCTPSSPSSPSTSTAPASAPQESETAVVKTEPGAEPDVVPKSVTRWMRRKNTLRLKLDGISPHSRRRRPARAPPTEPGARLLEMFSELVDARMESCKRVSTLVQRAAHRPDLRIC